MAKISQSLKAQIKSILTGMAEIQQVEDYPTQDMNGFPAVVISFEGNTSQYETTAENQELYTFKLYVFQEINDLWSKQKARLIIEELSDIIRDKFDDDEFLNGITLESSRVMLGVLPTISKIYEADEGKYVVSEIELAVRISKLNS